MIKTTEIIEATAQFQVGEFLVECGDILTVDHAAPGADGIMVINENGEMFQISSTFYRLCNTLTATGWFLETTSRREVEEALYDRPIGAFLVRSTEPNPNSHSKTLAIKTQQSVRNYRIYRSDHYYISDERLFETIVDLVSYYWDTGDGLTVRMKQPGMIPDVPPQIEPQYITMGDQIGKGHFGEVHKGRVYGKIRCAIKKLKKTNDSAAEAAFYQEAKMWNSLRHECIVTFYGISENKIVAELMEHGSLQAFLREEKTDVFLENQIHWINDIISAMVYLRQVRMVHRDIAARNILLSSCKKAKISDFGMAKMLEEEEDYYEMTEQQKLPVRWLSPEASAKWKFSFASDMWAVAVTVFEICSCGERPYKDLHNRDILTAVKNGRRLSSRSYKCKNNGKEAKQFYEEIQPILLLSWSSQLTERLTIHELASKFKRIYRRYLIKPYENKRL